MSEALQIIFKKSFSDGETPEEWRWANVTPIFKKGSKLRAENYRPVSLTSICCKVMEGAVRDELMGYLYDNDLISKYQHGFVKKKACVTNLLACQNKITKCLMEEKSMDVLYKDFSKAFDKVSHKKLLHKMRAYGIVGKMWKWIEAFLSDRKQCVVLGDTESSMKKVISSVPQGSVLGTILFTIFINDLPECLINECETF